MTVSGKNDDSTRVRISPSGATNIPARFSASVVVLEGHAPGMEYPLEKAYTVIGRDKDTDIPIKDALVSRQHAAIAYAEGKFSLKDLESTNGTIYGGGVIDQVRLKHKDTFRIGDTTMQFILIDTGIGAVYEVRDTDV